MGYHLLHLNLSSLSSSSFSSSNSLFPSRNLALIPPNSFHLPSHSKFPQGCNISWKMLLPPLNALLRLKIARRSSKRRVFQSSCWLEGRAKEWGVPWIVRSYPRNPRLRQEHVYGAADTGAGVAMPVELWMELRNQNGASVGTFYWRRMMSTAVETAVAKKDQKEENSVEMVAKSDSGVVVPSYWGIDRPKIKREDGSEWPWNCFMPWETYKSNTSIDLTKHQKPTTFLDKFG